MARASSELALLALLWACSPKEASVAPDSGSDAGAADSGRRPVPFDAGEHDAGPRRWPTPPPPPGLPEGWEWYPEIDGDARIYYPTRREVLPPALPWVPCPANAQPAGLSCRTLQPQAGMGLAALIASVENDKTVTIAYGYGPFGATEVRPIYRVIAAADGTVKSAILEIGGRYVASNMELAPGRVLYNIYDRGLPGENLSVVAGGHQDALRPNALVRHEDATPRSYYAGEHSFASTTGGGVALYDWSGRETPILRRPEDQGLQHLHFTPRLDATFFVATSIPINRINVFTTAGGNQPWRSFGSDWTKGAASFASDGIDMVWEEGSGRTSPNVLYPSTALYTAPYQPDPSKVQARRVTSTEGTTFSTGGMIVGCGRAAHYSQDAVRRLDGIRIYRLADGRSWRLYAGATPAVSWSQPLALSCEEIFIFGASEGKTNIMRVRLDSLGPGDPAD
jgi:hypothetical protein